ncbi:MAG: alpha/beta fold hydrolase [Chloroflexota bacterium]|nr:alpha/beta fold hydrolase [Chloroflexota bacterium]
MIERMIAADGVELATEAFGDPAHPPLLLIMGQMASMLWWPDEFCRRLAGRGRYVIRYDNRDTGRSTTYEPGSPPYTIDDMAHDTVRVFDAYGIAAAHVAGMSFGGMIGQVAALAHPDRVVSLTAISTSPFGEDTSALPSTSQEYLEHSERFAELDWTDRSQVIALMVEDARQIAGTAHPFNAARATSLIERDYDRAHNFASVINHSMVEGGEAWRGRLPELQAPLLVIHGTADPIFPIEHGEALADAVAGGSPLRLEGGGHELHEADWDEIIAAIVAHTAPRSSGVPAGSAANVSGG